jgi:plasmid stabilization system protein ParE
MAQTFEVLISRRALEDIYRNMQWWAEHHSVLQAIEFEETVVRQIATLAEMPERFGFAYENNSFEFELRQMPVGLGNRPSFRAIYTVRNCEVVVLAVRRGAEDEFRG